MLHISKFEFHYTIVTQKVWGQYKFVCYFFYLINAQGGIFRLLLELFGLIHSSQKYPSWSNMVLLICGILQNWFHNFWPWFNLPQCFYFHLKRFRVWVWFQVIKAHGALGFDHHTSWIWIWSEQSLIKDREQQWLATVMIHSESDYCYRYWGCYKSPPLQEFSSR